ncbi:hypothetical protein BKA57DRAFT_450947 [Linnemannia elongata]|nr:hypothetical protein BKA57DRAFT_450947 [Linnemannia elongata]
MVAPTLAFLSQSLSLSTLDPSLMSSLCPRLYLAYSNSLVFPYTFFPVTCLSFDPSSIQHPTPPPASHFSFITTLTLISHTHPFTIICISL